MPRSHITAAVTALALLAVACGASTGDDSIPTTAPPRTAPPATSPTTEAGSTTEPATTAATTGSGAVTAQPVELPDVLQAVTAQWTTDWSRRTIDLAELQVGISAPDPRDRIAPIDEPAFVSESEASDWLADREPGLLLEIGGAARFYPLQILTLHEIVNDELAGVPVAVTYCPLCNTAIVFDRRIDGEVHRLGVSGLLRNSDLVMWDDTTDSLFQQITGEGIVGTHAGVHLESVPSALVRFADARASYPDLEVLSQDTGFPYPYGVNPYEGYSSSTRPFLFEGELDPRYAALERVVGVTIDGESKAFPFPELEPVGAVNDLVAGSPIVVLWGASDTADALGDRSIASSRGVGAGVAFSRIVGGQTLTFERIDDTTFRDRETATVWTLLGEAVDGPLAGTRLEVVNHRNEFWFAWTAFFPDAPVYVG